MTLSELPSHTPLPTFGSSYKSQDRAAGTQSKSKMTKHQIPQIQHHHATRAQKAALTAMISESEPPRPTPSPSPQPPTSYTRAPPYPVTGPMAPIFATIALTALHHAGTETEQILLALSSALEKVEAELRYEEEAREMVRNEGGRLLRDEKQSMCSKVEFVEMLVMEAQRVDRESLGAWLGYLGMVVGTLESELEGRERRASRLGESLEAPGSSGTSGSGPPESSGAYLPKDKAKVPALWSSMWNKPRTKR